MNRNLRIDENGTDHYAYGLRKISFWEKYGVKRFPYLGKRRYSPFAYRSVDGGIVISNDVFGLTIRQFDKMYKACLIRRKTHEQYILNLRYPDKSSDEYMEYLQDIENNDTDHMFWKENHSKERYLYEHLVNTAGTEIDMRTRQQLFITQDMINNTITQTLDIDKKEISSGSLVEGIDLPGSDMDIMFVIQKGDVIRNDRNIRHSKQRTTLVMETDNDYPGFTYLRVIAGGKVDAYFKPFLKGSYLSVNIFVSHVDTKRFLLSPHGPCLSDKDQRTDFAFCLRSKYLPFNAIPWATRYRKQWPPNSVIDRIKKYGCLLVPIGPRTLPDCDLLWRLSFSVAEKLLVHSFNFTQLLCYCLLKLTLKHIVNTNKHAEGLLCSYFLKTALFWVSEEVDIDKFQLSKLYLCFSHCLRKLIMWVNNCHCPNYFIPEQNMFLGKICPDNNTILLDILCSIKCGGIDGLLHCLYQYDNGRYGLLSTQLKPSFIMLDLLFYKISHIDFADMYDVSHCLKLLEFTEYLLKSKLSKFIVDVCKCHHAEISQYAAQMLPAPTVKTDWYNLHKRYHRHLHDGIRTDSVSGWLFYASFYYVTGQFNVTLKLTDYVLSKYSPNMVTIGCLNYDDRQVKNYQNSVHSTMTLQNKMRIAVVSYVNYIRHSSLIPKELQIEVKDQSICLTTPDLCHCLRFLCYHHIGDICNRQQALCDLTSTVRDINSLDVNCLSNSLTILGVCFQLSGDKDAAYQCYVEALQCEGIKCATAEARRNQISK